MASALSVGQKIEPYKTISACRVCGSKDLLEFWNGGDFHIVEFPKIGTAPKKPVVPLSLMVCENCWLVQLKHTTNPIYLYEDFHYRSGINESMREALNDVSQSIWNHIDLHGGDSVLDIGCNDGTLLLTYPIGLRCIGVDPAKNLQDPGEQPGGWEFINDFFPSDEVARQAPYKAITALAMFYDLDDPVAFCKAVKKVLHKDGVFVVQMNYLPSMLKNCCVDNVVHEHLTYFSLETLIDVFRRADLYVYHAEVNEVNGGSIRVYAKHNMAYSTEAIDVLTKERAMQLRTVSCYTAFADRVGRACNKLNASLDLLHKAKKRVYAYGASTRGTTLLQMLDTKGKLEACAERDPRKIGHYMVGADLPIVSEAEFRKHAQYGLSLPYHFIDAIQRRELDWLLSGNAFIVPLPYPRLIDASEVVT